ncbi:MAG TPA: hypothetical protein VD884_13265 [Ohtaekwangia sp.]|nr:hypothetical protein [Ohtaekwangia sp.]
MSDLIIYVDGKPVGVTTGELTLPENYESCTESFPNYEFKCEGLMRLDDFKLSPEQEWTYQWFRSVEMPRKKKKAFRKYLKSFLTIPEVRIRIRR